MRQAFTLGYGGLTPDRFIQILKQAEVQSLADVRLRPDRAHLGAFVRAKDPAKGVEGLLTRAGIGYASVVELGNLFLGFEDWAPRYRELLACAGALLIPRLLALPDPICLMCAEKRVEECHRGVLAEYLVPQGFTFTHL